jgi:hypothetical protein
MPKMKSRRKWSVGLLLAMMLIPIFVLIGKVQPDVETSKLSKVVFYVS